ncbi:collagen-like protein, partial [Bacillus sonorensis]|nr:collagen-like protein [Bacillus sonorensis]
IGTGSVMLDHFNSEVKAVFEGLQKQIDELKGGASS